MKAIGRIGRAFRDTKVLTLREARFRIEEAFARTSGWQYRRFRPGRIPDAELQRVLSLGGGPFKKNWQTHLQERTTPVFFFSHRDRQRYQGLLYTSGWVVGGRADRLLDGAALLFGKVLELEHGRNWHTDPMSGYRWTQGRAWWKTPSAGSESADVRRVWELSRHRDLFVLGRAYWKTGDIRYARAATDRLSSWLIENPPETGVNWRSGLEVGVRALAWLWALHFFLDVFDQELTWEATGSLVSCARHLEQSLPHTIACMPGNHVIGEAAALACLGFLLPEAEGSDAWRRQSLDILEREAVAQVLSDGTHVERAPAYHMFVWELFQTVVRLADRNGQILPNSREALRRMALAIARLCRPDRTLPQSGDSDAASAYDLHEHETQLTAISAVAAVQFSQGVLKTIAPDPVEDLLWLAGPEGLQAWDRLPRSALPVVSPAGAIGCAWRSDWSDRGDYAFMRGGGLSRHTHADALHLDLVVGGVPVVVDAGTGSYNESRAWRHYFRGTPAHNTVTIDNSDQAIAHRAFRWVGDLGVTWITSACEDGHFFCDARHDGYNRIYCGHRRRLIWYRDWGWIALDTIEGHGSHEVALQWLFDGDVEEKDHGWTVSRDRIPRLGVAISSVPEIRRLQGSLSPRAGWVARNYGDIRPATSLIVGGKVELPFTIATFLRPLRGLPERVGIDVIEGSEACVVVARVDRNERAFEIPLKGRPRMPGSSCES